MRVTTPQNACQFPIDRTCLPIPCDPEEAAAQSLMEQLASDILWSFSGRQFGVCPKFVELCYTHPCMCDAGCLISPYYIDFPASNMPYSGPVTVTSDESILLSPDVFEFRGRRLYKIDGTPFPIGHLLIEYYTGKPIPESVGRITSLLAKELLASCNGSACKLPNRVQKLVKRGVTLDFLPPEQIFNGLNTGITEVDLWLASVNPKKLLQNPVVI